MQSTRSDYVPGLSERPAGLRRERGWSIRETGRRLGDLHFVDPGHMVRRYESYTTPTAPRLIALARLFGVSTDYLLGVTPPCGCNPRKGAMDRSKIKLVDRNGVPTVAGAKAMSDALDDARERSTKGKG